MQAAFPIVLFVVCGVGIVIALVAFARSGHAWREFGRHRLLMDDDLTHVARPRTSAAAAAEREEEVRQMLQARNARRARRGEPPIDVEAELKRLIAPPQIDAGLRAEIRELVIARNHRRVRRGEPPLDVEAEIERQIAALGDGL
jgi:hypothetical protein